VQQGVEKRRERRGACLVTLPESPRHLPFFTFAGREDILQRFEMLRHLDRICRCRDATRNAVCRQEKLVEKIKPRSGDEQRSYQ